MILTQLILRTEDEEELEAPMPRHPNDIAEDLQNHQVEAPLDLYCTKTIQGLK